MTGELISLFNQPEPAPAGPRALALPPPPACWPAPPDPAAYHGLPGQVVAKIAPHTEADPAAILVQLLICCGALIGRDAHYRVEATHHHPNEFVVLVGDSAKARKGSSFDHVARLLGHADPAFTARLTTGLSSGEGLIWAVRDPQGPDPGALDKRLLVIEPEFATVLKSTSRELSTLSPTLRSAWDGRPLALLTRTAPARATEAHISIIGHITQTELARHTTTVEIANGFLNRFIFAAVRRVRLLPEGGDPDPLKGTGLARYLTSVLKHAHTAGRVTLTPDARELWWHTYPQLTQPADGLHGQLTARAEAHVIRLALLYTLLDGQKTIQPEHLHPALALWDYASRSAAWALGQATGDPLAEHIHAALTRSPDGLTRTQIRDLCQRNLPADRVEQALAALAATGRASQHRTLTGGRPAEHWTAAPTPGA
ncbi:MAG TPA: hypothetical protein VHM72_09070 [Solirubrobacteraceae bacterium]|jgi:hypothetical protein|nr:hypothetical protein [Solirubrobacteraceae bacterium]